MLDECLKEEKLHPAIHSYIKLYIENNFENPKPLTLQCRKRIRRYFKGGDLRSFIENSDCPQRVEDFVLMKYLLQPLQLIFVPKCIGCSYMRIGVRKFAIITKVTGQVNKMYY